MHIRQIEIGKHIGKKSEEFIPDRMPEKQNSVCIASKKARPIYYICISSQDRLYKKIVFFRIIFEICILNHCVFTGCFRYSSMQSSSFSHIDLMLIIMNVRFRMTLDILQDGLFSTIC